MSTMPHGRLAPSLPREVGAFAPAKGPPRATQPKLKRSSLVKIVPAGVFPFGGAYGPASLPRKERLALDRFFARYPSLLQEFLVRGGRQLYKADICSLRRL